MWWSTAQHAALAVFYTWVYNNTRGSVLAVALLHATGNVSATALPYWVSDVGRGLHFGVLLVAAAAVVVAWRPMRLAKGAEASAD